MKAITLIALVITIVVLIILATVVINLSLGDNGIFNRAREAKEQYQNAQDFEETEIAKISNNIDYTDNMNNTEINDVVDNIVDGDRDDVEIPQYTYLTTITALNTSISLPSEFSELYIYWENSSTFVIIPRIALSSTEKTFRNSWAWGSNYSLLSVKSTTTSLKLEYVGYNGSNTYASNGVKVYYK